jgi:galactitol-specific phosphotransferase system IIC component
METNNPIEEIRYQEAVKRVKRIKGFYTHLLVYVVINIMILVLQYTDSDGSKDFWQWHTFSMVIFWGIGLGAHAMSVFVLTMLMGKDWEERKINELMEKDKNNKWE